MKIIYGILVMALIGIALAVSAVIEIFVQAAPYLVAAAVVLAIASRHAKGSAGPYQPPAPTPPQRPLAPPVSGWVLVPMWMGPPCDQRSTRFIDAEVIDDRGGPS